MWTEQRSDANEPFLIFFPMMPFRPCPTPPALYTLKLLDFEGSTIISEQFEQVKHQFVWPDMLLKWLIGKTLWSPKKTPGTILSYFKAFFLDRGTCKFFKKFIMSFMAHEETTFMLNLSSQGATLNFIAWKKLFVLTAATWLHTDKCVQFQIFSKVL